MKRFADLVRDTLTSNLQANVDQHDLYVAMIRAVLHTASLSAVELGWLYLESPRKHALRNEIEFWRGDGQPARWLEFVIPELRESARFKGTNLAREFSHSRVRDLLEIFRHHKNDTSHAPVAQGVKDDACKWLPTTLDTLLAALVDLLPVFDKDQASLRFAHGHTNLPFFDTIKTPFSIRGVDVRKGQVRANGINLQSVETFRPSKEQFRALFGWLNLDSTEVRHLRDLTTTTNIPQTTCDTFRGREQNVDKLLEWLNGERASRSRILQVVGRGGLGKTTLVLETLNRILSGALSLKLSAPKLIVFDTYKESTLSVDGNLTTHQGFSGLERIAANFLKVAGSAALRPRSWSEACEAIKATSDGIKITPEDVLFVVDNCETIRSDAHALTTKGELTRQLGDLAKFGRVLTTTRQRLECDCFEVEPLKPSDGASVLDSIGQHGEIPQLLNATCAALEAASEELEGWPIELQMVGAYLERNPKERLEAAAQAVRSCSSTADFLYQDAWQALTGESKCYRDTLIAWAQVGEVFSEGFAKHVHTKLGGSWPRVRDNRAPLAFARFYSLQGVPGFDSDVVLELHAREFLQLRAAALTSEQLKELTAIAKSALNLQPAPVPNTILKLRQAVESKDYVKMKEVASAVLRSSEDSELRSAASVCKPVDLRTATGFARRAVECNPADHLNWLARFDIAAAAGQWLLADSLNQEFRKNCVIPELQVLQFRVAARLAYAEMNDLESWARQEVRSAKKGPIVDDAWSEAHYVDDYWNTTDMLLDDIARELKPNKDDKEDEPRAGTGMAYSDYYSLLQRRESFRMLAAAE